MFYLIFYLTQWAQTALSYGTAYGTPHFDIDHSQPNLLKFVHFFNQSFQSH